MSFIRNAFQTMHPVLQIVMLGCMVLSFMMIALIIGTFWLGVDAIQSAETTEMIVISDLNQVVGFLGASLVFAGLVGREHLGGFFLKAPAASMFGLAVLIALGMSPLLDFTYRINEWMLVPGSALHEWAGALEEQAAIMTKSLLSFETNFDVVVVLFSVAVLPAVCEEWLFRGTVQSLIMRATGNIHLAVWIAAVLFSAVHMQFFGFIPRMLLGACFGYLVVFSGSLWPAILGHFINNAGVVLSAWWMGSEWIDQGLEPQPLTTWEWSDWTIAAIAAGALIWGLKQMTLRGDSTEYLTALNPEATQPEQTPLQW